MTATPVATIGGSNTMISYPSSPIAVAVDGSGNSYVLNLTQEVVVFPPGSNGNVTPSAVITGLGTSVTAPNAMTVDSSGDVYVASGSTNVNNGGSVAVYPAGSNGNATPMALISGSNTGIVSPFGIAVDSSGNIYVGNNSNPSGTPSYEILVFAAGSNGNVAPSATISGSNTGLTGAVGMALDSADNIYVFNEVGTLTGGNGTILVYPAASKGNVAPSAVISGSNTGLDNEDVLFSIALDSSGKIYVSLSQGFEHYPTILVFGAGPTGNPDNLAPTATIGNGQATGTVGPVGVAFDSTGNVYVANNGVATSAYAVTIYPAGSDGNVAPMATFAGSNTGLNEPTDVAIDGTGDIYVLNTSFTFGSTNYPSITIYAPGSSGNTAPIRTISGANTTFPTVGAEGMALDSSGKIYVNSGSSILVFAAGSNGNVAPIATISGSNTGLSNSQGTIAVDASGNILVPSQTNTSPFCDVEIFAAGSNGNVAPTAIIFGSNTGLDSPRGIALDSAGNVYVTNGLTGDHNVGVLVFAAGSAGNVAPKVEIGGPDTQMYQPGFVAIAP